MTTASTVRIGGVAYEQPAIEKDVEALAAQGLLQTAAAELQRSGFHFCRIADVPASELARRAVERLLRESETAPDSVQLLITASALPSSTIVPHAGTLSMLDQPVAGLDLTRYGVTKLQHDLGLDNARTLGVAELGCVALLNAVWLAHRVMEQEDLETAICVNADVMPQCLSREVLYSVMSDAGCAVLLTRRRDASGPRLVHHAQLTKGFYWNAAATWNEVLASYYPTGKRLIENTLRHCGLTLADIACILPNNVSYRSWEIMCNLLRLPLAKVYTDNIARHGHAMAADNFINLSDAVAAGRIRSGERVLMFGFGLGSHWACSVIET